MKTHSDDCGSRFCLLEEKEKKNPLLKPPIHPDLELLLILLLNLNLKAVGSRPGLFKHLTPELTTKTNNKKRPSALYV